MRMASGLAAIVAALWVLLAELGDRGAVRYAIFVPLLALGAYLVASELRSRSDHR